MISFNLILFTYQCLNILVKSVKLLHLNLLLIVSNFLLRLCPYYYLNSINSIHFFLIFKVVIFPLVLLINNFGPIILKFILIHHQIDLISIKIITYLYLLQLLTLILIFNQQLIKFYLIVWPILNSWMLIIILLNVWSNLFWEALFLYARVILII